MPYITRDKRPFIDKQVDLVAWNVESPGELNYAICRLLLSYLTCNNARNYDSFNMVIGVLECAKQELYRVYIAPYEDEKRSENGHVLETPGAGK